MGMESPVKAAMVRSSNVLTLSASPQATRTLRRTRSTDSFDSPRKHLHAQDMNYNATSLSNVNFDPMNPHMPASNSTQMFGSHSRHISLDMPQASIQPLGGKKSGNKVNREKDKTGRKDGPPEKYCQLLATTSSTKIDVEIIKKLRLYLRNEAAGQVSALTASHIINFHVRWTEVFLAHGGYEALLSRLNELLEIEWRFGPLHTHCNCLIVIRDEQHDDQCLHEVLRCFKALSTSAVGCNALRSLCPEPFAPLMRLLYSDKKPGDLSSRQLIMELFLLLFDIYPSEICPGGATADGRPLVLPVPNYPAPHASLFALLRDILMIPAPAPSEQSHVPVSPHDFIETLHIPRIYKTYLKELSDVCRDYFWVFCHPQNTIWILNETDEDKVERPKAPGGMTGGVEFEAMQYLVRTISSASTQS